MTEYLKDPQIRNKQYDHLFKSGYINLFIWCFGCLTLMWLFLNPIYVIPGALERDKSEKVDEICKYINKDYIDDCADEAYSILWPSRYGE